VVPLTVTLTGLVQTTFWATAPLLLLLLELEEDELELLDEELEELLLEDDELELDEELLLDELELLLLELELLEELDELLLEDELELLLLPPLKTAIRALLKVEPALIREVSTRKGKTGI
jgi:hypothetical protein